MDPEKLKEIREIKDYITFTNALKIKHVWKERVALNGDLIVFFRSVADLEIQYFKTCNETGAALILIGTLIKKPKVHNWEGFEKDMVVIFKHWLDVIKDDLIIQHYTANWWNFLKEIVIFIQTLCLKGAKFSELFLQSTSECLLELVTSDLLDLKQINIVMKCLNKCATCNKQLRLILLDKFEGYFVKLTEYMATCDHMDTQLTIMECLLRFLVERQVAAKREQIAETWFPQPLYSKAAREVFLQRSFVAVIQDLRDFIMTHNKSKGHIYSVECSELKIGLATFEYNYWIDFNNHLGSLTLSLNRELLISLGVEDAVVGDIITMTNNNTSNVIFDNIENPPTIIINLSGVPDFLYESTSLALNDKTKTIQAQIANKKDGCHVDKALSYIFNKNYKRVTFGNMLSINDDTTRNTIGNSVDGIVPVIEKSFVRRSGFKSATTIVDNDPGVSRSSITSFDIYEVLKANKTSPINIYSNSKQTKPSHTQVDQGKQKEIIKSFEVPNEKLSNGNVINIQIDKSNSSEEDNTPFKFVNVRKRPKPVPDESLEQIRQTTSNGILDKYHYTQEIDVVGLESELDTDTKIGNEPNYDEAIVDTKINKTITLHRGKKSNEPALPDIIDIAKETQTNDSNNNFSKKLSDHFTFYEDVRVILTPLPRELVETTLNNKAIISSNDMPKINQKNNRKIFNKNKVSKVGETKDVDDNNIENKCDDNINLNKTKANVKDSTGPTTTQNNSDLDKIHKENHKNIKNSPIKKTIDVIKNKIKPHTRLDTSNEKNIFSHTQNKKHTKQLIRKKLPEYNDISDESSLNDEFKENKVKRSIETPKTKISLENDNRTDFKDIEKSTAVKTYLRCNRKANKCIETKICKEKSEEVFANVEKSSSVIKKTIRTIDTDEIHEQPSNMTDKPLDLKSVDTSASDIVEGHEECVLNANKNTIRDCRNDNILVNPSMNNNNTDKYSNTETKTVDVYEEANIKKCTKTGNKKIAKTNKVQKAKDTNNEDTYVKLRPDKPLDLNSIGTSATDILEIHKECVSNASKNTIKDCSNNNILVKTLMNNNNTDKIINTETKTVDVYEEESIFKNKTKTGNKKINKVQKATDTNNKETYVKPRSNKNEQIKISESPFPSCTDKLEQNVPKRKINLPHKDTEEFENELAYVSNKPTDNNGNTLGKRRFITRRHDSNQTMSPPTKSDLLFNTILDDLEPKSDIRLVQLKPNEIAIFNFTSDEDDDLSKENKSKKKIKITKKAPKKAAPKTPRTYKKAKNLQTNKKATRAKKLNDEVMRNCETNDYLNVSDELTVDHDEIPEPLPKKKLHVMQKLDVTVQKTSNIKQPSPLPDLIIEPISKPKEQDDSIEKMEKKVNNEQNILEYFVDNPLQNETSVTIEKVPRKRSYLSKSMDTDNRNKKRKLRLSDFCHEMEKETVTLRDVLINLDENIRARDLTDENEQVATVLEGDEQPKSIVRKSVIKHITKLGETVSDEYVPHVFEDIQIKDETLNDSNVCDELIDNESDLERFFTSEIEDINNGLYNMLANNKKIINHKEEMHKYVEERFDLIEKEFIQFGQLLINDTKKRLDNFKVSVLERLNKNI